MTQVRHTDIDPVVREEIWQRHARISQISWGAIFAGTICALSVGWLMNFFGVTLGLTIADAGDYQSIGEGFAWMTAIWIFLSMLVAYFIGGWIAARLAGRPDDTSGMLHGMTVWGLGTIATLVMVSMGVSNVVYSGYQVLSGGVQAAANITSAAAAGVSSAAQGTTEFAMQAMPDMQELRKSELVSQLAAEIKERAVNVLAKSENPQGANVSEQDIRTAMNKLDDTSMQNLVTELTDKNREGAKKIISEKTDLSPEQIDSLLSGMSKQIQEKIGTDDNNKNLVADVKSMVKNYTVRKVVQLDEEGGPELTETEVRNAINSLSYNEMKTIGARLVEGKPEAAKNVLIASTNLSRPQVNEVVDGVYAKVKPTIEEYHKTVEEIEQSTHAAVEKASDYTRAVLWTVFASSALALAVSLLGGKMGADEAQKNVVHAYSMTRSTPA